LSLVVLAFVVGFAPPARIVAHEHLVVMSRVDAAAIKRVLGQSRSHLHDSEGIGLDWRCNWEERRLCAGDNDASPKSENWPQRSHSKTESQRSAVRLSGRPQIGQATGSDWAALSRCMYNLRIPAV
jgi:hypothetical protein